MAPPAAALIGIAVGATIVVGYLAYLFSQKEENDQHTEFSSNNRRNNYNDEQLTDSYDEFIRLSNLNHNHDHQIRLSNLSKNHDHQKVKHHSEARANAVILKMRDSGKDKDNKLQSYYNTELNGWFVGNSKYD